MPTFTHTLRARRMDGVGVRPFLTLLVLVLAVAALLPRATQAQPRQRCFNETGYCVSDPLLNYWERNGGLPVFGYPISEQRIESVEGTWTGPVQWFERDRLEDHGREGVLAGRLGARYLDMIGKPWTTFPGAPGPGDPKQCTFFAQTGHILCGRFRSYWERNGGLMRFGYPITKMFEENVGGRAFMVQYFERRRMEYHPENAGTDYEVLLGLLGRNILENANTLCAYTHHLLGRTVERYYSQLGCPQPYLQIADMEIVTQPFERGWMVWVPDSSRNPGKIFVIVTDPNTGQATWSIHPDTWREGFPLDGNETPPPGLYAPVRGFGYLWWRDRSTRFGLGWATEPERGGDGSVLVFANNGWMIYSTTADRVWVLRPDASWEQTTVVR